MTAKAGYSTPLLNVADVERSIRFYSLLGFETIDVQHAGSSVVWARMQCEGGALMFMRAEGEEPAVPRDRFSLYLYTPDLPAMCSQLAAAGVPVGPVTHPEYMRSGEVCISDPDGYVVFIGHWGVTEHEEWELERQKKQAAGVIQ